MNEEDDDEVQIIETAPSRKRSKNTLFGFGFGRTDAATATETPPLPPLPPPPSWGKLVDEPGANKVLRLQRFLGFVAPPTRSLFTPSYRNPFNDAFNRVPGVGHASSFSSWGSGVRSTLSRGCLGFGNNGGHGKEGAAEALLDDEHDGDDHGADSPRLSLSSKARRNFNFILHALARSDVLRLCPADVARLNALRQTVSPAAQDHFWTCYLRRRTVCRVPLQQQQKGDDDPAVLLQELMEKRALVDVTQDEATLLTYLQDVLALLRADELSRLVPALLGSTGNGRATSREDSVAALEAFIAQCQKDHDPSLLRRKLGKGLAKWLGSIQQQRQRQGQAFRLVRVEPSLAKLLQRVYALFFLEGGFDGEDAVVLLWNDLKAMRFLGSSKGPAAARSDAATAVWEVEDDEVDEEKGDGQGDIKDDKEGTQQQHGGSLSQPMGPAAISPSYARFFDRLLTLTDAFEHAVAAGDAVTAYACLHAVSDVFIPPQSGDAASGSNSEDLLDSLSALEEHDASSIGGRLHTPPGYRGLHHLPRPLFKLAAAILGRGIHLLERERKHGQALHYLHIALEGTKHLAWSLRGHFHIRLVLDLGHANRPGDALQACEEALADPSVKGEDRLFLQTKCLALSVPPRRWKKPSFPALQAAPVLQLELGDLQNRRNGGKSLEDRVLDYLLGEGEEMGQWKGAHCENNVVLTLFGLLCWNVLWPSSSSSSSSDTSTSGSSGGGGGGCWYRNAPHGFLDGCDFLTCPMRRQALDTCLARVRQGEVAEMLAEVHAKHLGVLCIGVDWSTFTLAELQAIAQGLGPAALCVLCETLASDYSLFSHGFPDLLLWRTEAPAAVRFVEVKGPGDSLSHAQMYWIDRLQSVGVGVEVARVVEGGKVPARK